MPLPGLIWLGSQFKRQVVQPAIDARMRAAGEAGVAEARRLVPVDTGQTQNSISYTYDAARNLLQLHADTSWSVFLELGTRRMAARPFLRPGLMAAAKAFGGNLSGEVQLLNTPQKYAAGYQSFHRGGAATFKQRGLKGLLKSPSHLTYKMNYGARHHD